MRLSKKQRLAILSKHCGVINSDDAIDPRHYFNNKRKAKNEFRKSFQLCRQVAETLHMVLSATADSLADLSVVDVVPAPDSRRMLVVLKLDNTIIQSGSEIEQLMERLHQETPRLRSEIAQSINRRKTPQLVFEITTSNA